ERYRLHDLIYVIVLIMYLYFFFFQAEDGIRVRNVTGVQTCALPIWPSWPAIDAPFMLEPSTHIGMFVPVPTVEVTGTLLPWPSRSEERRVGQEGRSRSLPYDIQSN